jgi:hypothetical protein
MPKQLIFLLLLVTLFESVRAQKGERSIAVGLLYALPNKEYLYPASISNGVGLEGIFQYNFTDKSAILFQLQTTFYTVNNDFGSDNLNLLSIKGGYRYQLTTSGIYANVLGGFEQSTDASFYIAGALGGGKRFTISQAFFIDAGIDYVVSDINRFNLKAVFSVSRRPKKY